MYSNNNKIRFFSNKDCLNHSTCSNFLASQRCIRRQAGHDKSLINECNAAGVALLYFYFYLFDLPT